MFVVPVNHAWVEFSHHIKPIEIEGHQGTLGLQGSLQSMPAGTVSKREYEAFEGTELLHETDCIRLSCVKQLTVYSAFMPARKSLEGLRCSVANTVELIGDHWTVLILRDAFMGIRRFDEFHKDLGIARNVLADRLGRLVDSGILVTRLYEERPPRSEYLLTDKGKDLFDVLVSLRQWGDRWNPPPARFVRPLRHQGCGEVMEGVMCCSHCGEALDHRNVRLETARPALT